MAQKERTTTQRALKRRSSGSGGGAARAAAPGHAVLMLLVSAGLGACSNSGSDTGANSAEIGCQMANENLSAPNAPNVGSWHPPTDGWDRHRSDSYDSPFGPYSDSDPYSRFGSRGRYGNRSSYNGDLGGLVDPEVSQYVDSGEQPSPGEGTCSSGRWGFTSRPLGLKKVCCTSAASNSTEMPPEDRNSPPEDRNSPPSTEEPILMALTGAAPSGSCLSRNAVSQLIEESNARGRQIFNNVAQAANPNPVTREQLPCPAGNSMIQTRAAAAQTATDAAQTAAGTPRQPPGTIDNSAMTTPPLPQAVAKALETPLPPPRVISNPPPQQPTSCPTAPGAPTTGGISSTWCQTPGSVPGSNPIFTPQMPAGGQ